MYIFCIVLILIASILLILAVLAQNPKSGMAANFGASNQVMGVRQTADFLGKFPWVLAISIVVLSLIATMTMPSASISSSKSGVERALEQSLESNENLMPQALPAAGQDAAAPARTLQNRRFRSGGGIGRFRRTFYEFIQKRCPTKHVEHLFHFPAT